MMFLYATFRLLKRMARKETIAATRMIKMHPPTMMPATSDLSRLVLSKHQCPNLLRQLVGLGAIGEVVGGGGGELGEARVTVLAWVVKGMTRVGSLLIAAD